MAVTRYWDDGHMDGGWGVLMVLMMLALGGLLAAVVVYLVRATRAPGPPPPPPSPPHGQTDPEQVLADRLARGEIDPEDYQARLAALRSSR
jgi:putative membrane protein